MSENRFKFFSLKPNSRIPSPLFGEIDLSFRGTSLLIPTQTQSVDTLLPLILSNYDQLIISKNRAKLLSVFTEPGSGGPLKEPLPGRANNFCAACRARFDDYWRHITGEPHAEVLRESQAFLAAREVVSEVHEKFLADSLSLRLDLVDFMRKPTKKSRESGWAGRTLSSALRSLGKNVLTDAGCQTSQPLNPSTAQQLNPSTAQQLNPSTAQQLNPSHLKIRAFSPPDGANTEASHGEATEKKPLRIKVSREEFFRAREIRRMPAESRVSFIELKETTLATEALSKALRKDLRDLIRRTFIARQVRPDYTSLLHQAASKLPLLNLLREPSHSNFTLAFEPLNPSTPQPFQPLNPSTLQPLNPSTLQPLNPSLS